MSFQHEIFMVESWNLGILWGISLVKHHEKYLKRTSLLVRKLPRSTVWWNTRNFHIFLVFVHFCPNLVTTKMFAARNIYSGKLKLGNIMENVLGQTSWKKIWKWLARWSANCLAVQYGETREIFIFSPFLLIFVHSLLGWSCHSSTKYLQWKAET